MTFATVLILCLAGIALCAGVVFVVETVVALCLREQETFVVSPKLKLRVDEAHARGGPVDRAA